MRTGSPSAGPSFFVIVVIGTGLTGRMDERADAPHQHRGHDTSLGVGQSAALF
jgi:hypothetical protein